MVGVRVPVPAGGCLRRRLFFFWAYNSNDDGPGVCVSIWIPHFELYVLKFLLGVTKAETDAPPRITIRSVVKLGDDIIFLTKK